MVSRAASRDLTEKAALQSRVGAGDGTSLPEVWGQSLPRGGKQQMQRPRARGQV